ncbi:hypothetical protein EU546_01390 [Candidatus Thorarchaeota archaeon]|nr:MAG: hypothetical protein EU546_01390 [Candidatus Thorarchaeota archaeon]
MKAKGTKTNHGWILIALGITILFFRAPYDPFFSILNSTVLLLSGFAVVIGQYRDPEGRSCSVCAATTTESKLGPRTNALPLVLPIILLIITPMIAVDSAGDDDWVNWVVGEKFFDQIPENRTCTNLFELANFGSKYDGLAVEVNGSILQRRSDGFQLHQYVPLCTCCPPVEVTMWVYFTIQHNPDHDVIVESAELGKEELYLVIGMFFYDEVQNFASILLIHIEPLVVV